MYSPAEDEEQPPATTRVRVDYGTRVALAFAAAAVLFLGILPGGMLDFAKHATQLLSR
jgi:NADH:ubiquinone oxidoreductase subunit 2 (subunit N)